MKDLKFSCPMSWLSWASALFRSVLMNYAEVFLALDLQEKFSALKLIQAKFHLSENTVGGSDCSSAFDRSNGVIEGIPTFFSCCC